MKKQIENIPLKFCASTSGLSQFKFGLTSLLGKECICFCHLPFSIIGQEYRKPVKHARPFSDNKTWFARTDLEKLC